MSSSWKDLEILGDEPPPEWWVSEEAERRREAWEKARVGMDAAEWERRSRMSLRERLTQIVLRRMALSNLGSVLAGAARDPRAESEDAVAYLDPRTFALHFKAAVALIEAEQLTPAGEQFTKVHLSILESALDAHVGRQARTQTYSAVPPEEKDRILLEEGEGMTPEELEAARPDLGDARLIRALRRKTKRRSSDGRLWVDVERERRRKQP